MCGDNDGCGCRNQHQAPALSQSVRSHSNVFCLSWLGFRLSLRIALLSSIVGSVINVAGVTLTERSASNCCHVDVLKPLNRKRLSGASINTTHGPTRWKTYIYDVQKAIAEFFGLCVTPHILRIIAKRNTQLCVQPPMVILVFALALGLHIHLKKIDSGMHICV